MFFNIDEFCINIIKCILPLIHSASQIIELEFNLKQEIEHLFKGCVEKVSWNCAIKIRKTFSLVVGTSIGCV